MQVQVRLRCRTVVVTYWREIWPCGYLCGARFLEFKEIGGQYPISRCEFVPDDDPVVVEGGGD